MIAGLLAAIPLIYSQESDSKMYMPNAPVSEKYKVDTRIDNMSYWKRMASLGLVPVAPETKVPQAKYTGSKMTGKGVMTEDSQDVPVTTVTSTQSENSVFVNPQDNQTLLQSNNSTPWPVSGIYGANGFLSEDGGQTWGGEVQGAGGENSGDPSTAISLDGRYYVGYIHSNGGQGVSYSTNQGQTWTPVLVANSPGGWGSLLDKNHLWIDNSPTSSYAGYLYDAWTNFGGSNDSEIEISKSSNQGVSWSSAVNISSAVNAGSHNQGVNISTGPNGEVYVIWAIYDGWPTDESAIGMAKSFDGGATWMPATRIITNIRGIRTSGIGKSMRVNSFPYMTVDISNGPNRGTIYVSWSNIGVPGTNTGSDADAYMIKSSDQGATWSTPVKINQDASGMGKKHYFSWITSDPSNGNLSVVYYDDRNVSASQCEVYVSNSTDGGESWEDLKVSDVAFTPTSIPGLADSYFGDYLGITARDRWVYPVWTDNRSGFAMTYISPFQAGPPPNQPWIIYNSSQIDDAAGNGNGLLDFNESVNLTVSLENIGDRPATAVNAVLSTESAYVTITDNTELFGNFAVGELKTVADAFSIQADANTPDGEKIVFTLTATDANDSTFVSNFIVEVHSPALSAGGLTINDGAGNGNGRLDPGESATITIAVANPGDYTAANTMASITTASPFIIIIGSANVDLGDIQPGILNQVYASFDIEVAPETPVGHAAIFNFNATSETAAIDKSYTTPVGLILEDWESGGFNSFDWQFSGNAPWTIVTDKVFEGENSSKSGDITDNQTSEMDVTYNVMSSDSISFYCKVSSESSYDYLKFYVDNTLLGQWSGEVDWERVVYTVTPGNHTFKWIYSKDVSLSVGGDAAWVDYIVFPVPLQTTAFAGPDAATCESASYLLNGSATNYTTVGWTTSGDGVFDNAASLSAFYTPGAADVTNGSVTLTLTVNGPEGQIRTDNMELTIAMNAAVAAGNDVSVCAGGDPVALNATVTNSTELLWTTTGTGSFDNASSATALYTPSADDYAAGSITLTITATSAAPCAEATDGVIVTFIPIPSATLSGQQAICNGTPAEISIDLAGEAPWSLELNNGVGTLTATESPLIVTVSPSATSSYQVLTVSDANNCQAPGNGESVVEVYALPIIGLVADTSACANHTVVLTAHTSGSVSYLWTPGDFTTQSISVDTLHIGMGAHSWMVNVTDENNCSSVATSTVNFVDCTGIGEPEASQVMVYPNPAKGAFSLLTGSSVSGVFNLEILDADSRIVYRKSNVLVGNNARIEVNASLANGVYLVTLSGTKGNYSTKLVVKH